MSDTAILAGKQDAALSIVESKSLSSLEQVIERGQKTFMEVGKALLVIQEQKLYRQDYKTFAEYCNVRWGFAKSRAYQMIDAAKVVGNVHQGGQIEPPTTERQARPLASLPAAQQANAWADVVNECAERGEPITAAAVVEVVEKYKAQAEPNSETDDDFDDVVPDRGPCSPAFNNAPLYIRTALEDGSLKPWKQLERDLLIPEYAARSYLHECQSESEQALRRRVYDGEDGLGRAVREGERIIKSALATMVWLGLVKQDGDGEHAAYRLIEQPAPAAQEAQP